MYNLTVGFTVREWEYLLLWLFRFDRDWSGDRSWPIWSTNEMRSRTRRKINEPAEGASGMPGISGRPSGWAGEGDATEDITVAPVSVLSAGSGLSTDDASVEACRMPVPNCCPAREFSYSSILSASAALLPFLGILVRRVADGEEG